MNNKDIKETALYLVLAVFISVVVTFLLYANAYAQDPHHPIPEPVVNITNVTRVIELPDINITYVQDNESLEKSIAATASLSSLPSVACKNIGVGCLNLQIGVGSYKSHVGLSTGLEYKINDMAFRATASHSGGEAVYGVGSAFGW